jgi:hypothetical protein
MKMCLNYRRSQVYFVENRNAALNDVKTGHISPNISTIEDRLLKLVKTFNVNTEVSSHAFLTPSAKHSSQHDAIISRLERMDILNSDSIVVELGAGKADLSEAIAVRFCPPAVIAVDMDTFRHCADCRLRRLTRFKRVAINIRDFHLGALVDQSDVICVSKHLCGVGYDYALRCIVNEGSGINAIAMAPCCHQKCDLIQFTGRPFLHEFGFTDEDFTKLCRLSSWATRLDGAAGQYVLGRASKWVIDSCRVRYLRENGFECELIEYVSTEVTPENMIIEGKRNRASRIGAAF